MLTEQINKKTAEILQMPKDSASDIPKMIVTGREQLYCCGCKGIRLYTDTQIRFAASGGIISISGSNLMIKSIDEDEITISGKINMIEFI